MTIKDTAKRAIKSSLTPLCERVCPAERFVPPGHFYSPISSPDNFKEIYESSDGAEVDWPELERRSNSPAGIDFNEAAQLELLESLGEAYKTRPDFPDSQHHDYRFYYLNHYYSYPDATVFYCLVNTIRPRRIIDVAGGNTTTLMLDMNDTCFRDDPMHITLIEPHPERVEPYLGEESGLDKLYCRVQEVDEDLFRSLEPNDVLFLDTTHISKMGGEVNYLAFRIFPLLKPGVVIHIHEIFYPFEYPSSFFRSGKSWNEIYMWRAFLMHNKDYEILMFNSWLSKMHTEAMRDAMPDYFKQGNAHVNVQTEGSSLWLRKL
jgi:hypothetical protein